ERNHRNAPNGAIASSQPARSPSRFANSGPSSAESAIAVTALSMTPPCGVHLDACPSLPLRSACKAALVLLVWRGAFFGAAAAPLQIVCLSWSHVIRVNHDDSPGEGTTGVWILFSRS